jgi:K+-sensing histidine kinase KdpD
MPAIAYLQRHPYCTAILNVGLALLLMLALDPLAMMTQTPFLLFFGAVVVSAWQGGIRSGLVATGLAALISNYFFLEPKYSFALDSSNGARLAIFVSECILISILCGSLRTTNQRLDRNLSKLKTSEESLRTANHGERGCLCTRSP